MLNVLFAFVGLIAFVMLLWLIEVKLVQKGTMHPNAGARVSGPLFSMSASGTVGKAITFGIWKGRPWCRVWFKPENPKTEKQVNVRYAMTLLVECWQAGGDAWHDLWDAYAAPFTMSGFNKFVSRGMDQYVLQITTAVKPASVGIDAGTPPAETFTWA